jgi:hypothetical protein
MTFLQSLFLAGLAAAVIPVIIHLLNRPRARVVPFSTLEFIRRLQIKRSRRLRVRELLLLVLRVLLVALIALAFARPALQGAFAGGVGGRARTSACIVLDVSYSMGFREGEATLLDRAKDRAHQIVRLLREGDEAFLILASDAHESRFETATHDFRLLDAEIDRAAPSARGTDLRRAVEEAVRLLEGSRNPNREIYLITDLQAVGFPPEREGAPALPSGDARVYVLPVGGEDRSNLSIEEAELHEPRVLGESVRIRATVAARSRERAETLVNLFLDGKPAGTAAARIEAGGTESVLFSALMERTGVIRGEIRLAGDRLPVDDVFYFVLDRPENLRVLIVSPVGEKGSFFVRNALDPGGEGVGIVRVTEADPSGLATAALATYHAVFLVGVPSLDEEGTARLEEYVLGGGGVVIIPGDGIDFGGYNTRILDRLTDGVRFGPDVIDTRERPVEIGEIREEHPLFSVFRRGLDRAFREARVSRYLDVDPGESGSVLASVGGGKPLLVEAKKGAGRVLVWAIGHDLGWSDLPVHSIYLPLLQETVRFLYSGGALYRTSLAVGEPYRKDLFGVAVGGDLVCTTPTEEVALQPRSEADHLVLSFDRTSAPGFYHIEGGGFSEWFAVNVATAESDLEALPVAEVAGRLSLPAAQVVPADRKLDRPVMEARFGRELWWEILFLALLLAAVEMTIARSSSPSAPDRG